MMRSEQAEVGIVLIDVIHRAMKDSACSQRRVFLTVHGFHIMMKFFQDFLWDHMAFYSLRGQTEKDKEDCHKYIPCNTSMTVLPFGYTFWARKLVGIKLI